MNAFFLIIPVAFVCSPSCTTRIQKIETVIRTRSVLLFLLLLSSFSAGAQAVEGKIRYIVTHNWTKKMAAVDYLSVQSKERAAYLWGNDSEWKVYMELYLTPFTSKYQDSEEKFNADEVGYNWKKDVYYVTRDFRTMRMFDAIQMLGKTYLVEDSLECQTWKILNDMKEVAGHVCMNASWQDTLKGQQVIAWFALDLPSGAGPDRFCGLPGLILEVDINDGAMVISADKLDLRPATAEEMALPKKLKGKKVDAAAYRAVIRAHIEEKKESQEVWFWGIRY
jgi:GLPGLI family protein